VKGAFTCIHSIDKSSREFNSQNFFRDFQGWVEDFLRFLLRGLVPVSLHSALLESAEVQVTVLDNSKDRLQDRLQVLFLKNHPESEHLQLIPEALEDVYIVLHLSD
jgi:hypothetical protein